MSFPVLLTLNLATTDQPLREYCRGDGPLPTLGVQRVVCENAEEADRVYAHWINRKIAKDLPAGGGWTERFVAFPTVR